MALKKKQLDEFQERLLQLRAAMTQHLKGAKAEVQTPEEAKGYSQHQADEGTEDFDRRINIELTSMEADTLRQVDRALEKLKEGTYGICDVSGEEIPLKRLEAIPYATMTRDAQEKLERGLLQ
ncbi:MAG: TraR/DksA family transcriptional regulator [Parachlamydiales bacterium]